MKNMFVEASSFNLDHHYGITNVIVMLNVSGIKLGIGMFDEATTI